MRGKNLTTYSQWIEWPAPGVEKYGGLAASDYRKLLGSDKFAVRRSGFDT